MITIIFIYAQNFIQYHIYILVGISSSPVTFDIDKTLIRENSDVFLL